MKELLIKIPVNDPAKATKLITQIREVLQGKDYDISIKDIKPDPEQYYIPSEPTFGSYPLDKQIDYGRIIESTFKK